MEDRIGQLPNDILVHILSFLDFKDAARTSVLSKYWTDEWKCVPRLDFDAPEVLEDLLEIDDQEEHDASLARKRRKFVKRVNKVLKSRKVSQLDAFRVAFDLDKSHSKEISKWLQYEFARGVKMLELNLLACEIVPHSDWEAYTFPHRLLARIINSSPSSFNFKSVRALTFRSINVSGDVLEFFLQNCPFLESLVVERSGNLKKLEVCGQSLALKYLEILNCLGLRTLVVRDLNIIALKTTEGDKLVLKNVPMLVDVWIFGWSKNGTIIRDAASWLSCCFSKLEVLTLQALEFHEFSDESELDCTLAQLSKLRRLELLTRASNCDATLIAFTSMIPASPNLEKFVLHSKWDHYTARQSRELKRGLRFPLQHLKDVEFRGYYGRTAEVELVEYLLENGVALERILVDPCPIKSFDVFTAEEVETVRNYAKQQLDGLVPPHVKLLIL